MFFLGPLLGAVGGAVAKAGIGNVLGGVGSLLGGIAGMKQAGQKGPTVHQNLLDQAKGARDASAQYGFNPLTMLQYGQTGATTGNPGGGAAALASIDMLTDGLKGVSDVVTGDAARRRAADQLNLDLARLRVEQARSGVILGPATGASDFPDSPSPLGRRAVTVMQSSGGNWSNPNASVVASSTALDQSSSGDGAADGDGLRPLPTVSPVDPRREVDNDPVKTHSGFITIDNPYIPFPVHMPTSDGDEGMSLGDLPVFLGAAAMSGYQHYIGRPFAHKVAIPAMEAVKPAFQLDHKLRPRRKRHPIPGFKY